MNETADKPHTEMTDDELALALQAGDDGAFDELVRRHQGRVYGLAYRITGNREDALDVSQEAFVKAYRKIGGWRPTAGFVPWMLRLTSNQAIDTIRRRKRHAQQPLEELKGADLGSMAGPATEEADRGAQASEIGTRVQDALDVLSETQRAVFVMRHFEGMQLAEIADVLGCTVGSVKVHLFRSLKKLQKELGDLR